MKGVKAPSVIAILPTFDPVRGVVTVRTVVSLYKKLTGEKSGNEVISSEGDRGVGKERPVQLSASQVVAIEHLLGLTITKQCGIIYSRFVANHQLYSSAVMLDQRGMSIVMYLLSRID